MAQGQSVYLDIALHISYYCVYCIKQQHLTQITNYINAQDIFKESRNLIGTENQGINNIIQTDK